MLICRRECVVRMRGYWLIQWAGNSINFEQWICYESIAHIWWSCQRVVNTLVTDHPWILAKNCAHFVSMSRAVLYQIKLLLMPWMFLNGHTIFRKIVAAMNSDVIRLAPSSQLKVCKAVNPENYWLISFFSVNTQFENSKSITNELFI